MTQVGDSGHKEGSQDTGRGLRHKEDRQDKGEEL